MAFLREVIDMFLGDRKVELCKGHVIALYRERGSEAVAHVKVENLEDAERLEAAAKGVEGMWQPHYRYDGKPLSVSEFAAAIDKGTFDPSRKQTTVKAKTKRQTRAKI